MSPRKAAPPRSRAAAAAADVTFFESPAALRKWFAKHHDAADHLWVGFHKKDSGTPSVTWAESVDEALCVGWIDGIRKRIDDRRYKIRFTPRRRGSVWSAINIARVAVLKTQKRMQPRGLAAFAERRENRSGIYAYEQRPLELAEPYRSVLHKDERAYAFFRAQPPSYRKRVTWWVVSAKREATRTARLAKLIEMSAGEKRR